MVEVEAWPLHRAMLSEPGRHLALLLPLRGEAWAEAAEEEEEVVVVVVVAVHLLEGPNPLSIRLLLREVRKQPRPRLQV